MFLTLAKISIFSHTTFMLAVLFAFFIAYDYFCISSDNSSQSEGKRKPEPDLRFNSSMIRNGSFIGYSHSIVAGGFEEMS
jgi:hypothetical protein